MGGACLDTVGFCWIILFAEVAGPVIPRARNLSIRMIEQNPTSERRRFRDGHDAPGIYTRFVLDAKNPRPLLRTGIFV